MQVKAVTDKVIVHVLENLEEIRESGLIIPSNIKKHPQDFGRVISVGDTVAIDLKEGELVAFHQNAGQIMIIDGNILRVLKDGEIYCIVKEDTK